MPSYTTAAEGEAETFDVLAHMLGGGPASALYETLAGEQKLAVSVGAYYVGTALDDTRLYIFVMPAEGVELKELDAGLDRALDRFIGAQINEEDLRRAKTRMIADAIMRETARFPWRAGMAKRWPRVFASPMWPIGPTESKP